MFPIIIDFGPITLRSFGLMAAFGFFAAYIVMKRLSMKVASLPPDAVAQLLVFTMFGGAFGARIAYVAEHWEAEFAGGSLLEVLRFDRGGLMFYGGFIGAIIAIAYFAYLYRHSLLALLDLTAVALPLGHAFGRIGCFLNGCCYGRVTDSAIGICYPAGSNPWWAQIDEGLITKASPHSLSIMPSQLIEAGLNVILFALLYRIAVKTNRRGLISAVYLISYAFIRFYTETLRSDPRMAVGPFTIAQFICLFILAAGVIFLAYAYRPAKKAEIKE